MLRDLQIALSLANLCYIRVWGEALVYNDSQTYLMKSQPTPGRLLAIFANVLAFTGLFFTIFRYTHRKFIGGRPLWLKRCFLLILILPANAVREEVAEYFPSLPTKASLLLHTTWPDLLAASAAMALIAYIIWFQAPLATKAARMLLLFLAPFTIVTFGAGILSAVRYDAYPFRDHFAVPRQLPSSSAGRAIWIIFDEMDYRLAFAERRSGLELPEFDRLRGESIFATNAHPPAGETLLSLPALITGKHVVDARRQNARELQLRFAGSEIFVPWSREPNVFSRARHIGVSTALAGFFHPYCRVIGEDLNSCAWWEIETEKSSKGVTFWESLPRQIRSIFETSLMSPFGQSLATQMRVRTYRTMMERARQLASDPAIGLALIHLPVPHPPHAYNRATRSFLLSNSPFEGYVDSLALADRALGELRATMQSAGLWDSTAVLISSDHWYRNSRALDGKADSRIPFLLKLPRQTRGIEVQLPFSTILTHDLLIAILNRQISSPLEFLSWLPGHCTEQHISKSLLPPAAGHLSRFVVATFDA